MPFFVEDFRWTSQNYRSMAARGAELRRWWSLAEPIRELLQQGPQGQGAVEELLTVEEPWRKSWGPPKNVDHFFGCIYIYIYKPFILIG